ncbi:hypothetical protein HOLleu_02447 [Holothuria leucospilota]|uniref:Ig-like domain-containing protein n=1 Tax=Holothuria leucospilota TaxID=206669 RepID=A0A9Q1HLC4_HOLLE|nr:hypothetical protein HOLleu_02447 [Holothuria leucospilota]
MFKVGSIEQCTSPQYLEHNEVGIINCVFQDEPLRVLWYKSLQTTTDTLIIKLWDLVKDGRGYASGEYDIFLNGSLKINNVSSLHDGYYTVVKFRSLEYDPEQYSVLVVTTVQPSARRPTIKGCPIMLDTYCLQLMNSSELSCQVNETRPPIPLQWILRTPNGERNLSSAITVKHHNITSTTLATTSEAFYFTSVLSLLVCKAHTLPQMLDYDETTIIVENRNRNFSSLIAVQKFVERNSKFVLLCSEADIILVVWKKSHALQDNFEPVLHAVLFDKTVSLTHYDSYELNPDGSLAVRYADVVHEGLYGCVYETDVAGGLSLFNVTIYVFSVPEYPVVTGCNKYQYCSLEAKKEGSLTCSVTGIRPLVHIEVGTFTEEDAHVIAFTDREIAVIQDDDVYDIRITVKYRMKETFRERITLECRISAPNTDVLKSTTKFDLLFTMGKCTEPLTNHSDSDLP